MATDAKVWMKRCPIPDCQNTVSFDVLMCTTHWEQLPVSLRRKLYVSYQQKRFESFDVWMEQAKDIIQNYIVADIIVPTRGPHGRRSS